MRVLRAGWLVSVIGISLALAACSSSGGGGAKHGSPSPSTSPAAAAVITTTVPATTTGVSPATPMSVTVAGGTISTVTLKTSKGAVVAGQLNTNHTTWLAGKELAYGTAYTLTAVATNADGKQVTTTRSFSTVTPSNYTMPYLQRTGGYGLTNGATYGVGIVPVVHFDEAITDKAAAEKALTVTTTPHVDGSWYWADDQNVHWRPQNFYPAGTQVTVSANVYGVRVGSGLYGQANQSASFTIGAKHVSIADDKTHYVKVYFNDQLMRSMPTSMGQGGWVQGKDGKISLWTMPGTYTVLDHGNPVTMSSDSYGLPAGSPYGYPAEPVYWATKISTDGIYLHELDTTVWAQGHQDLSHGCLNLNQTNARWYYQNSQIGDVVEVEHSGGPGIEVWQGGDWSVPWSTWVAGSALH